MKKTFLLSLLVLAAFAVNAQTTILSESFNTTSRTATPPAGWTVWGTGTNDYACSPAVTWEQVPSGGFNCFGTPNPLSHSGSGMAGYNAWDIYNGGKTELISPALNFSGPGTTTLNVWIYDTVAYYFGFPNTQYDSMSIWVNTSPTSSGGTQLYLGMPSYTIGGTGWTLHSFSIPTTYTGTTNYIIFRGASLYGNDIFFDDVTVVRNPPTPCAGTPLAPSITTAAMSSTSPLCAGSTKTLNAVDPNFPTIGGITYQWEFSSASTGPWSSVTTGTGANTLSYTTGALATSTYFRMGATCTASAATAYTSPYLVVVGAPQPGVITGNPTFCPGDASTYSVPSVASTTYTWTLPPGWTGTSSTNSITVTPSSTAGTISVTASNSCGTSIPQTKAVVAGTAPAVPGLITGPTSACANSSQTYSIAAVTGATSYVWSLPAGWGISSTSSGGLSVTVTTSTTSGNVTVNAVNGCGSTTRSLAVTVVTSLPNPGTISISPALTGNSFCAGALYTLSVAPVPGVTSYVWNVPSTWSGSASGNTLQVFAGTSGGPITVTAYSACSTSPTSTLSAGVSSAVTPTISISTSATICQSLPDTFTAASTNGGANPTYVWMKNGNVMTAGGPTYIDNKLSTGDIITAILVSNAACRTADSTIAAPLTLSVTPLAVPGISINTNPVITICSGTSVTLTTNATGGGNSPGYQWYNNGIAIPTAIGPTYTTSALNNNDTITVKLTTSAACPYVPTAMSNKVGVVVNNLVVPSITVTASSVTTAGGMPITFTATQSGGGPTPVYQWILNNVDIAGATSDTYTTSTLRPGDHVSVRMQSYDPCAQPKVITSSEVVMDAGVGITAVTNWEGTVSLYPNPSGGRFTIGAQWNTTHTGKRVNIDVVNVFGQRVYHSEVVPNKAEWHYDVQLGESVANGQYVLRLSSEDGMNASKAFTVNR